MPWVELGEVTPQLNRSWVLLDVLISPNSVLKIKPSFVSAPPSTALKRNKFFTRLILSSGEKINAQNVYISQDLESALWWFLFPVNWDKILGTQCRIEFSQAVPLNRWAVYNPKYRLQIFFWD